MSLLRTEKPMPKGYKSQRVIIIFGGKAWDSGYDAKGLEEHLGVPANAIRQQITKGSIISKSARGFVDYAIDGIKYPPLPDRYMQILKGSIDPKQDFLCAEG